MGDGKHIYTVKVGEKGQIVIPKEARNIFNIKSGDTLILLVDEKQGIAIPPSTETERIKKIIFGG